MPGRERNQMSGNWITEVDKVFFALGLSEMGNLAAEFRAA
jgi:hypothetical protein